MASTESFATRSGQLARQVMAALSAAGHTVSAAESLTGGLLSVALADAPGAGKAFRGGVVAYTTGMKRELLGVDPDLLRAEGPVDPQVAAAMARGVRRVCGTTYGLATTGAAGPAPHGGAEPGTVFVALATPTLTLVDRPAAVSGDRHAVQANTVRAVLELFHRTLRPPADDGGRICGGGDDDEAADQ
ncbi:CinA family protein [Kitasatospora sp. NPDC059673]|uniref:CinA family protein n=1 Tax=Kitasatospora sp. NPDC059673 TaxID=3346901 RepID=UPI0036A6499A